VIKDTVLPIRQLQGLYHVSSRPIDKFSLLCLIAREYGKYIEIEPDDRVVVDRSLNSGRFLHATGYVAPDWTELIARMHNDCAVDYMGSW
jgi:dTDP-4-dehydrorhamnose reductase